MRDEPVSVRVYRRLLRLYPAGFRDRYAAPLERQLRDELHDSNGAAGPVSRLDVAEILRRD